MSALKIFCYFLLIVTFVQNAYMAGIPQGPAPPPSETGINTEELENGYELLFAAYAKNGKDVLDDWIDGTGTTSEKPETIGTYSEQNYRNPQVGQWTGYKNVRFELYKDGQKVAYVNLKAESTTRNNWFSSSGVDESSNTDIRSNNVYEIFSMEGQVQYGTNTLNPRFPIINTGNHVDCDTIKDDILMAVINREEGSDDCFFNEGEVDGPKIIYSDENDHLLQADNLVILGQN